MDGQLTRTNCEEAGDYFVPNVLSPRDLVSRPDNMDETVLSSMEKIHLFHKMELTFIILYSNTKSYAVN